MTTTIYPAGQTPGPVSDDVAAQDRHSGSYVDFENVEDALAWLDDTDS